jgi:mannose-6-phosphate isomerase
MTWHPVRPGDFFHVPAGTVHAIGAGLSLLEIQQNVDLTYRLYDYGRPRPLQLDEGIAAALAHPFEHQPVRHLGNGRAVLCDSPKFAVEQLSGASSHPIVASEAAPAWLMPVAGDCRADGTGLAPGTVWLADTPADIQIDEGGCLLVARAGRALT